MTFGSSASTLHLTGEGLCPWMGHGHLMSQQQTQDEKSGQNHVLVSLATLLFAGSRSTSVFLWQGLNLLPPRTGKRVISRDSKTAFPLKLTRTTVSCHKPCLESRCLLPNWAIWNYMQAHHPCLFCKYRGQKTFKLSENRNLRRWQSPFCENRHMHVWKSLHCAKSPCNHRHDGGKWD